MRIPIAFKRGFLLLGIFLALGILAACGGAAAPELVASPTANAPLPATALPTLTAAPPTPTETPSPEATHPPTVSPSPSPAPATPTPESGEISWEAAKAHVGETLVVCGPVVDARYASSSKGKPTFLNIGKKYPDPDRFTVLIWRDARDKFPSPPEELYLNQTICVYGEIEEYDGLAEIVVEEPAQIEIR